jgi:hypothetical protein
MLQLAVRRSGQRSYFGLVGLRLHQPTGGAERGIMPDYNPPKGGDCNTTEHCDEKQYILHVRLTAELYAELGIFS